MNSALFSKCLAEMIGTFAMVFAGCGSIVVADLFLSPGLPVPFVFGLVVMAMIYSVGHISGAHFNPAVTLAFAVARHFPYRHVAFYMGFQLLGAFLAVALLALFFPQASDYGTTLPAIDTLKAALFETVLTFFLMFVIIAVATDTRAEGLMAGVAIGATVALCAWFGGPVTGASMNPARTLAPNVMAQEWTGLWIYIVGPVVGAILAALTYEKIRCVNEKNDTHAAGGCC